MLKEQNSELDSWTNQKDIIYLLEYPLRPKRQEPEQKQEASSEAV